MKKTIITTATALALLATPFMNKADAATFQNDCNQNMKVVQYDYKTNNIQDLQTWMNQLLSKYNVQGKTVVQQNKPTTEKKPVVNQNKPSTGQTTKPATTKPTTTNNQQSGYTLNAFEKQVVDLTNKERAKNGLPALSIDTELSKVARIKSNDMATNKYFDHNSPTYGSPFDMMKKFGISYRSAGENIAMGQRSPEEVVNGWMNSPGHRANILNKSYTNIGVGYVANGNYWTQEFIGK
ncbi:CAP domain-containing protein [Heyndrickxia sp. NPDC080065]|uniref:CAP domain-containing protein n=1 Tax=Heyndrickxia sp. NPDC080065 TaxID=3390568 RepID=UPI003D07F43A